jgi:ABC-2 type transport system permease protein
MSSMLNSAGLIAVWKRQLGSLLGNPLGYIFILAFVVASAAILFLPDFFFTRNICDLGYLLSWGGFPMMAALLVVVVPALTMGAWASERDAGTEELLLTMPLSMLDAILGKYLAVMSFVTLALACSLSNVVVLAWIGDPDVGLILANYIGWWLAAAGFAAWSLLASVLVTMPAIAFVIGALLSAVLLVLGWWSGFFEDFNRGVLPVSGLITALSIAVIGLAAALLMLASRRWRVGRENSVFIQCLAAVLALVLVVNIARIGDRHGIDADLSSDGIASLAPESVAILKGLDRQVRIAAFISQRLPESAQLKAKELEDRLAAIKRYSANKVKIEILRPKDALADEALHAQRDYNLKPHRDVVENVTGKELEDVFLSVAITSGGRTQLIEYVDPGVQIEYELMQAIRTVGSEKKRVLGIATTDLAIAPGFDMRTQQMRQPWRIHTEWAKQYDVREVNLDEAVADEVDALIVPQPSSLTEAQMHNLHDYIWHGRPCLLMEDPTPIFTSPELNASQPKPSAQQNPYGGPSPEAEPKGNLKPLLTSLGLDFDLNRVVWSDYNPSHAYRKLIPPPFVWSHRETENGTSNFADNDIMRGFTDILFPFPGMIREAKDKPSTITVEPLITPTPSANWGWNRFSDHFNNSGWGGMRQVEIKRWAPETAPLPALAVRVTGIMPSAYPEVDPAAADSADSADSANGENAQPSTRVGVPSAKPVNVVVIADTDFCNDTFFEFYRDVGKRFSNEDDARFLRDLRNVQFAANTVDTLVGEQDLMGIRSRVPPLRKLAVIDQKIAMTQAERGRAEESVKDALKLEVADKQAELNEQVAAIDKMEGLDDAAKSNLRALTQQNVNRALQVTIDKLNRKYEGQLLEAKAKQQRDIEWVRVMVKVAAVLIPFLILAGIAIAVWLRRIIRESSHVPASRARSTP